MKTLLPGVLGVLLSGCVVVVHTPTETPAPGDVNVDVAPPSVTTIAPFRQTQAQDTPTCGPFELPDQTALPGLPDLTVDSITSQSDVESALIDYIFEIRDLYKTDHQTIQTAYTEYQRRCGPTET